jgi:hypothetical protein
VQEHTPPIEGEIEVEAAGLIEAARLTEDGIEAEEDDAAAGANWAEPVAESEEGPGTLKEATWVEEKRVGTRSRVEDPEAAVWVIRICGGMSVVEELCAARAVRNASWKRGCDMMSFTE